MIEEHKRAILTVDVPDYGLKAGDVGVVVHVYSSGGAYEMEFFTLDGQTLDVVTVEANQVRAVNQRDVMHARSIGEVDATAA
jgi:hypothetical protein